MGDEAGEYEFDVALSFAGEDRELVGTIASLLKERGLRLFYDEDFAVQMWGEDLYVYLDEVYRERARFAVIFVSRHYVSKPWTNHERQSVQARALESEAVYALPVRLDDARLPGLRPTVRYLDARSLSPAALASAIIDKCSAPSAPPSSDEIPDRVPRSDRELRVLLETRPFAWEYFLYAATLLQEGRRLEPKYRDHEVRFAQRSGRSVRAEETAQFVSTKANELRMITSRVNSLLSPEAQERAFGRPGEPGAVDRIVHIGRRIISMYEDLLDWAAEVRGTVVASEARELADSVAQMADRPISEVRAFIDTCVRETDALRARFATEASVEVRLSLIITADERLAAHCTEELQRVMWGFSAGGR